MKIVANFFIFLLKATRSLNHTILGPSCCKFAISCTEFAIGQLREKPLFKAILAICKRILCCNPFFYNDR